MQAAVRRVQLAGRGEAGLELAEADDDDDMRSQNQHRFRVYHEQVAHTHFLQISTPSSIASFKSVATSGHGLGIVNNPAPAAVAFQVGWHFQIWKTTCS
jgi:hypothetical protein